MFQSIFHNNEISLDLDAFMQSIDYKYLEIMYGKLKFTKDHGFIEFGIKSNNPTVRIAFYDEDPEFNFIIGIVPDLAYFNNKNFKENKNLKDFGYSIHPSIFEFQDNGEKWTSGSDEWLGSENYNMSYELKKVEFKNDVKFQEKWNPKFDLLLPLEGCLHKYKNKSYIDRHQDMSVDDGIGEGVVLTVVQWFQDPYQDRELIVGQRSLKDLERLLDTYVNGSYKSEDASKPQDGNPMWERRYKATNNYFALINNMNPSFYHGVEVKNDLGIGYSQVTHIKIKR
jgi:hypothetical protein